LSFPKNSSEFYKFCLGTNCVECPYKPFCKIDDNNVHTIDENFAEIVKGIRKEKLKKLLK